jgi:hypothetical protein
VIKGAYTASKLVLSAWEVDVVPRLHSRKVLVNVGIECAPSILTSHRALHGC